jgi:hypothetical protein
MSEYVLDRGQPYVERIPQARALEIYAWAVAEPDIEVTGSLEDGGTAVFTRWFEGVALLRTTLRPVRGDGPDG